MKVEWSTVAPNLEKGVIDEQGRDIASTLLTCQWIQIGGAPVKAGIVGHVFTAEDRRGQGLGRRIMDASLERMRAKRCPISFLFGIPKYYIKLGYAVIQHYYATMLACGQPLAMPPGFSSRRYAAADLPAVMRIYRACNRFRTGTFVRGKALWESATGAARLLDGSLCAVDARGKLKGYAKIGAAMNPAEPKPMFHARYMAREGLEDVLVVPEAAAVDAAAAQALLAALYEEAARQGRGRMLFLGPPDHELAQAMYGCGGAHRTPQPAAQRDHGHGRHGVWAEHRRADGVAVDDVMLDLPPGTMPAVPAWMAIVAGSSAGSNSLPGHSRISCAVTP